MFKKQIIFLMGPTASGKTQCAVELVQRYPCDIISVDSAMVYRGMDIGTAKPTPDILTIAPHRLIDIRDPSEPYSAAQFREEAWREIDVIHAKGRIPLLVGGTMLYFKALQQGLAEMPSANPEQRAALLKEAETSGWPLLHERLQAIDPVSASRIHPNDAQRIQRALEVYLLTGKNRTDFHEAQKSEKRDVHIHSFILAPTDRSLLHQKIEERFLAMLKSGFIDEANALFSRSDLNPSMSSIRSVGYRQAWDYLSGEIDYPTMREKAIIATRQFAKRQLTWLRHWPDGVWFESESPSVADDVANALNSILKGENNGAC